MTIALIGKIVTENLCPVLGLTHIDDSEDLFSLGMTSLHSVSLMMAIEEEFKFHFPHTALQPDNFESISKISQVVEDILKNKE
ncbi:phosphopantetheine-binding protein [Pseudomonas savastanoi]|uniref:Acyl carrier protein n=2 Tax=Pseudomonas savastanoi TaxID=29438 RepID=A0A3M6B3R9_PSESS|nr:phosphopantetheine-binding protein [Pseudomonas savastanoi]KPX01604.1 Acyl carrier protein [Pseudomonas syringae pv. cunninghamiae]MBN4173288.1 hypothetical protein [Pseudomonas savastanoi pv. phaseolicola]RMM67004.1 hypothetical protein ALQ73_02167 [Pseudomonas savastanoi pv. glycinea]RMV20299.1 Acyl carrier protein [Pseudomonas savastanoi]RMV26171.1 Acyl carrier protein [Pseudomonas savastanoi]